LSLISLKRLVQFGVGAGALALSVTVFTTTANASGPGGTATPSSGLGPNVSTQTFTLANSGGATTGLDGTNASCSADSTTGSTTADAYMIPAFTDPGSVTVSGGALSVGNVLYTSTGTGIISQNVGPTTGVIQPNLFSFSKTAIHVTGGILQGGSTATYEIGYLCWNANTKTVTDWWNAEVTFTATPAGSYTWTAVPGPPSTPPATPETPLAVGLPLGGGAVIIGGLAIQTRRRRRKAVVAG